MNILTASTITAPVMLRTCRHCGFDSPTVTNVFGNSLCAACAAELDRELDKAQPCTPQQAERVSLILDYAEFCGMQEVEHGGAFELWTLRKAIPGHPKGSTVTRATLLASIEQLHACPSSP